MQQNENGHYYSTFREFLLKRHEWLPWLPTRDQWPMLCDDNGNILVDRVCRTEHLQEEFDWICERVNFPKQTLPSKPERRRYQDYYDDESRAIVADLAKVDITLFKYTCEG